MPRRNWIVAIAIGVLLLILLWPYLFQRRESSRRTLCEVRQIRAAEAVILYASRHNGQLPGYRNLQAIDAEGQPRASSWVFPLLPYVYPAPENLGELLERKLPQQGNLPSDENLKPGPYADIHERFGSEAADDSRGRKPTVYVVELVCPANPPNDPSQQAAWLSFVVNTGMPDAEATDVSPADWPANGVFMDQYPHTGLLAPPMTYHYLEEHDGINHTLLLSENVDSGRWTDTHEAQIGFVWVAASVDGRPDPAGQLFRINERRGEGDGSILFARPSSFHPSGVNATFCDSSSTFLHESIDYLVYTQLMSVDGKNVKYPGTQRPVEPPYRIANER